MRILNGISALAFLVLHAITSVASAEPVYTAATGARVGVLEIFRDCDVCPEMVVLPMGSFTMGSSEREAVDAHRRFFQSRNIDPEQAEAATRAFLINRGINPDKDPARSINPFLAELPAHRVVIDMPIAMGRNEVTRAEWDACVNEGGCATGLADRPHGSVPDCGASATCGLSPDDRIRFRLRSGPYPTDPRAPRTAITYQEMNDYAAWLNGKIGTNLYRLPTEAEWEYAARAGTTTPFAQGQTLRLDQANFLVSRLDIVAGQAVWTYDLGSARALLPVDRLDAANPWGLRHMSGNASELTSSCGAGPHRDLASSSQYLAADAGRHCDRADKGGMYTGNVELARPARRVAMPETHWSDWVGFRLVRDLGPAVE